MRERTVATDYCGRTPRRDVIPNYAFELSEPMRLTIWIGDGVWFAVTTPDLAQVACSDGARGATADYDPGEYYVFLLDPSPGRSEIVFDDHTGAERRSERETAATQAAVAHRSDLLAHTLHEWGFTEAPVEHGDLAQGAVQFTGRVAPGHCYDFVVFAPADASDIAVTMTLGGAEVSTRSEPGIWWIEEPPCPERRGSYTVSVTATGVGASGSEVLLALYTRDEAQHRRELADRERRRAADDRAAQREQAEARRRVRTDPALRHEGCHHCRDQRARCEIDNHRSLHYVDCDNQYDACLTERGIDHCE